MVCFYKGCAPFKNSSPPQRGTLPSWQQQPMHSQLMQPGNYGILFFSFFFVHLFSFLLELSNSWWVFFFCNLGRLPPFQTCIGGKTFVFLYCIDSNCTAGPNSHWKQPHSAPVRMTRNRTQGQSSRVWLEGGRQHEEPEMSCSNKWMKGCEGRETSFLTRDRTRGPYIGSAGS